MKFDVIIIGSGVAGMQVAMALQQAGLRTASIGLGRSINEVEVAPYERLGGTLLIGDSVREGIFEDGLLKAVRTVNLGSYPLEARHFVIATGKFLGYGLVADMDGIYEPIFNLDVTYDPDRSHWFNRSFDAPQPFLDFGVRTDEALHPSIGGRTIRNLFACGELLAGVSATRGKDETGASARKVIDLILQETAYAES